MVDFMWLSQEFLQVEIICMRVKYNLLKLFTGVFYSLNFQFYKYYDFLHFLIDILETDYRTRPAKPGKLSRIVQIIKNV